MGGLWERVKIHGGVPVVGPDEVGLRAILERLDAGEEPAAVAEAFRLGAADLISALGHDALGDDGSNGLPLIRSRPRHPRRLAALEESGWGRLLPGSTRHARLALAAGLIQIHDAWEASHEAAQQADDLGERRVSSYWHGIAHRREPDSGNASYWFRRVGRHPVFTPLATAAAPLLEEHGDRALVQKLIPGGAWNPFAFIDVCGDGRPRAGPEDLARKLQRLEMVLLLEATVEALGIA